MICKLNPTNTINGNYTFAARRSCAKVDYPSVDRAICVLDGEIYERAIWHRVIWRNNHDHTLIARFVVVNGINYQI